MIYLTYKTQSDFMTPLRYFASSAAAAFDQAPFRPDENAPLPNEAANRLDLANLLGAAIQRMKNANMSTLLELLYVDPSPALQEVAEKMGITVANAKTLHKLAKDALKKTLLSLAKVMNIATETPHHES